MEHEIMLTPKEQAFAEENHNLIWSFMNRYQMDDELYGRMSIRYLKTVQKYLHSPDLQRHRFSTIVWYHLRSELSHVLREENQTPHLLPLDEVRLAADSELDFNDVMSLLEENLTGKQMEVLKLHSTGLSYLEIGSACDISKNAVSGRMSRLREKMDLELND